MMNHDTHITFEGRIHPAVPVQNLLGEGPVWDQRHRALCWVDILAHRVYQYVPRTGRVHTVATPPFPSAIVPASTGDFLLAVKGSVGAFDLESGDFSLVHPIEPHQENNRCNDGKCDPQGRFWIGTMAMDETQGAGSVYRMQGADVPQQVIGNATISNGMAWDTQKQRFYYIDTPKRCIMAYDYDAPTGAIGNPRPVINVPPAIGWPDGMTIDVDGKLWVALWDGWAVVRFDPDTGRKLQAIRLPMARPTSCTFGNDNLDCLYVTSATVGLSAAQRRRQSLAGALLALHGVGTCGMEANCFKNT